MTFKFQGKDDPERKAFYEYTKAHTAGKSPTAVSRLPLGGVASWLGGIAVGLSVIAVLAFLACIGVLNVISGNDEESTRAIPVDVSASTSLPESDPSRIAPRSPSHIRTTESPPPTYSPSPAPPPPKPARPITSIRDPRGDAEAGPAGGAVPAYVDLIGVSVQPAGPDSAAVTFTTAGRIPNSVPLYDEANEINYGAFLKQNGQEVFLNISSRVETDGEWKVVAIDMFGAFKADRVRLETSPTIQGSRLAIEIPVVLEAGGATVDLRQPIALSAESGAVIDPGGWTDQA